MLVKDIILKVCDLLEKPELADAINSSEQLTQEQNEEVEKFVKCLNLVRNEVATEMIPNAKMETILTEDGRIDFQTLSSDVIEILSVKDGMGNSINYDSFPDHILTTEGKVKIKYNASPEELNYSSEFSSTLPQRVWAYGVVREYYFIQSLYQDASVWDERFKNSIQALTSKKSETVIPRRRWE